MNTQPNIQLGKVIAQSWSDAAYKARLMEAPAETLREAGINVPSGVNIRVVEQAISNEGSRDLVSKEGEHFVLTLPLPPAAGSDSKIEDEQLEAVAGGICCCCSNSWSDW